MIQGLSTFQTILDKHFIKLNQSAPINYRAAVHERGAAAMESQIHLDKVMLTVMSLGTSTLGMLASRHAEGQGRTQHKAHMSGEGTRKGSAQRTGQGKACSIPG